VKTLTKINESIDDIRGTTLDERARLVLLTLGKTPGDVRRAFRKLANRYHPDKAGGNTEQFQLINEAYELLMQGTISNRPLLANDDLVIKLIGKRVEPLLDKQKEWAEYERWRRNQFYGIGAL